MDETAITPGFRLNNSGECIEGAISTEFQDEQNENKPANKMLLFIYKSVYSGKKIPIAYYFTYNAKTSQLKAVTDELIFKLESAGAKIHGLVSDMASTNVSLWKAYGAKCDYSASYNTHQCSSEHPCDFARKLFFFPDYEHVIKNIRNFLLDNDLHFGSQVASIAPVKALVTLEEEGILPKFTDLNASHVCIKNSFAKMKVKPAIDLFSSKTAQSLSLVQEKLESEVHPFTNEEVEKIKITLPATLKLFTLFGKSVDFLFGGHLLNEESLNTIDALSEMVVNSRFISANGTKDTRPKPSQFGLKLFSLAATYFHSYMNEFLNLHGPIYLHNINSACIENSFSQIKSIYSHPTSAQAAQGVRWLIVTQMNLNQARNSSSSDDPKLLSFQQMYEAAKRINKTSNDAVTVINIPANHSSLSSEEQITVQPVINETLKWINSRDIQCDCLSRERMIQALNVTYKNLADNFDRFKQPCSLTTKVFAQRVQAELITRKFISQCHMCKPVNTIERFVNICVKRLLVKVQEPLITDHSSRGAFVATSRSTSCNRPSSEAMDSLKILLKKKRSPFSNLTNSSCVKTYSKHCNK